MMGCVDWVLCHWSLLRFLESTIPHVLFVSGLDDLASLPDTDFNTFAGNAVDASNL
jgi:hypothetical protein